MTRIDAQRWALFTALVISSSCSAELADQVEDEQAYDPEPSAIAEALTGTSYASLAAEELPGYGLAEIEAQLPLLKQYGVSLVLHWPSAKLGVNDPRWAFVAKAQAMGVVVKPWLLLPEGTTALTGYFPNSTNATEFVARAKQLITTWNAKGLKPATFIVDMELRKDRLDAVLASQRAGTTDQTVALLASYVNRAQFAAAKQTYKGFVDWAHSTSLAIHPKGPWKVQVGTLPQLIDDYTIGDWDDDLAQAFNSPIEGAAWDNISFMTFRTLFSGIVGKPMTSYFVYDYARYAKQRYGARAGVVLGVTDVGVTPGVPVYKNGSELRDDLEAAILAGISPSKIDVYSLKGVVAAANAPAAQWFPTARTGQPEPAVDEGTTTMHTIYWSLDALLNVATIGR